MSDQCRVEGYLDVGDSQRIHWWAAGAGVPVVAVHGGPGSGCGTGWAGFADPRRFRTIGFDQRGCGLSTPDAADPATDLAVNTTAHLVADLERLREHLDVDRWIVLGGSWGSTLGLAYAQAHPMRVRGMVLFSVVTTTSAEVAWVTRAMGRIFPQEWARFVAGVPAQHRDGDLAAAYGDLLASDDPAVRAAAAQAWCAWEDVHVSLGAPDPDPRYQDERFRYRFARLVTHYWRHHAFLPDGQLEAEVGRLHGIPAVLIQGRLDVSGPPDIAYRLAADWPQARVEVVGGAGHGGGAIPARVSAALDSLLEGE